MSTPVEHQASAKAEAHNHALSVGEVLPAFLWVACALGIMCYWLQGRSLLLGPQFSVVAGVMALCTLALFGYATLQWSAGKKNSTQLPAIESRLRFLLSAGATIGGLILLFLAVWIVLTQDEKLLVFPVVSSVAVLGLVCISIAFCLRLTSDATGMSRKTVFQSLANRRAQVAIPLIVVGLILGILGGYLLVTTRTTFFISFLGGPEGLGLLFLGLVLVGAGGWLQLTLDRPASADAMRVMVQFVGSLVGLIIAVATALRVRGWANEYLAGGLRSWQGPEAWRFWACAYIELLALLLIFGSLLLARTDIRANVTRRRMFYGYNTFLTGMLLLSMLVLVNRIVTVLLPSNLEWTATEGIQSVSGRTVQVLESLKDKVTVYVLLGRGTLTYLDMRDLLDNCQGITDKLNVVEVSPDINDDEYANLIKLYPELDAKSSLSPLSPSGGGRGILVVYGAKAKDSKLPHAFIPTADILTENPQTNRRTFAGERLLMQNIRQLALEGASKTKIYFTQGNGELWVNDLDAMNLVPNDRILVASGAKEVVSKLKKDNFDVMGLIWEAKPEKMPRSDDLAFARQLPKDSPEVPEDCGVLVIANPDTAFPQDVLDAIDRYMAKKNGKLVVLTRAGVLRTGKFAEDGMIDLCKKYNVEVSDNFVMRFARNESINKWLQLKATVVPATQNKAARNFADRRFVFYVPRTVTSMKGTSSYQVDPILQVSDQANGLIWVETNPLALLDKQFVLDQMQAGKISPSTEPLIVAVSFSDRDNKPRGLVFGDYTFITSTMMQNSPAANDNYDFFRSCISWLAQQEVIDIGISPKEGGTYQPKDTTNVARLVWLPIGLMVLGLGGIGTGIWVIRRK